MAVFFEAAAISTVFFLEGGSVSDVVDKEGYLDFAEETRLDFAEEDVVDFSIIFHTVRTNNRRIWPTYYFLY